MSNNNKPLVPYDNDPNRKRLVGRSFSVNHLTTTSKLRVPSQQRFAWGGVKPQRFAPIDEYSESVVRGPAPPPPPTTIILQDRRSRSRSYEDGPESHRRFRRVLSPGPPAKPWFLQTNFLVLLFILLSSFWLTLDQLKPIIQSTANTIHNAGQVLSATAHVGHALGDSVDTTTRISRGVTGAVGDVWCFFNVKGKSCQGRTSASGKQEFADATKAKTNSSTSNDDQGSTTNNNNDNNGSSKKKENHIPPRVRGGISGDMALEAMYDLAQISSEAELDPRDSIRAAIVYIRSSPYLKTFSTTWWEALDRLPQSLVTLSLSRESSVRTSFNSLNEISRQYDKALEILDHPEASNPNFLARLFKGNKNEIKDALTIKLRRHLARLVLTTRSQSAKALNQLAKLSSMGLVLESDATDLLEEIRPRLRDLVKEREWRMKSPACKNNPLLSVYPMVSVMGGGRKHAKKPLDGVEDVWSKGAMRCEMEELNFAVEWLEKIEATASEVKEGAHQTWRISVRLSDYLSTFVQAFNSTASVHRVKAEARPEDEEGVDFEFEDDAWIIARRLKPGMMALKHNLGRDSWIYRDILALNAFVASSVVSTRPSGSPPSTKAAN